MRTRPRAGTPVQGPAITPPGFGDFGYVIVADQYYVMALFPTFPIPTPYLHVNHVVRDALTRSVELLGDINAMRAEQRRDLAEHAGIVLVDDA